jgi:hypothetical protein
VSTYRVIAVCLHDEKPDVIVYAAPSFPSEEIAALWMNDETEYLDGDGDPYTCEMFSQEVTIDCKNNDGYWLDDIIVVPADDPEWNAVDWPEPEPEHPTYCTVLQFSARDDEHARAIAVKLKEVIEQWWEFVGREEDEPLMMTPQGYCIEAAHLVDADDWAEHVGVEDVCFDCGESGGTNQSRNGTGNRVCPACIAKSGQRPYRIERALI